jgi:hypothetical protein
MVRYWCGIFSSSAGGPSLGPSQPIFFPSAVHRLASVPNLRDIISYEEIIFLKSIIFPSPAHLFVPIVWPGIPHLRNRTHLLRNKDAPVKAAE